MTQQLMDLVCRIDEKLAKHFENENINLLATGVRWIGCLMVRVFPINSCARLWDSLIAEYAQSSDEGGSGFEALLLYFCVCFLGRYSVQLQQMDFEAITMFL